MDKLIVVSSFFLEGRKYEVGESISPNAEQRTRLIQMGLIKVEKVKGEKMEKAPVDKMVKSAPKKKSSKRKKKK